MFIIKDDNNNVLLITNDINELAGEAKEKAIEITSEIPNLENIAGKDATLKYNGTKLYYEYTDRPLTKEERLQQQLDEQSEAIAELTTLIATMSV